MAQKAFEVMPGKRMNYVLIPPAKYDPTVPTPFVVSVSGLEQTHVNGFSRRLPSDNWVVAVPLRPQDAPLLFTGTGAEGDGLWHLWKFCRHLLETYNVEGGRFLMVGVSNGGNAVLRFGMNYGQQLCRGLVVVTAGLSGSEENIEKLQGLPIDMYVGSKDECGFYRPMVNFEACLRAAGQKPPALLTVFEGAGHCCSPMVDKDLIHGKIRLMLLGSGPVGKSIQLDNVEPGTMPIDDILMRLCTLCEELGLEWEVTPHGRLHARKTEARRQASAGNKSMVPNVSIVRSHGPPKIDTQTPSMRQQAQAGSIRCPSGPSPRNNLMPATPAASSTASPRVSPTASPMASPVGSFIGSPTSSFQVHYSTPHVSPMSSRQIPTSAFPGGGQPPKLPLPSRTQKAGDAANPMQMTLMSLLAQASPLAAQASPMAQASPFPQCRPLSLPCSPLQPPSPLQSPSPMQPPSPLLAQGTPLSQGPHKSVSLTVPSSCGKPPPRVQRVHHGRARTYGAETLGSIAVDCRF